METLRRGCKRADAAPAVTYDELAARPLLVLPERPDERLNRALLEQHQSGLFLP